MATTCRTCGQANADGTEYCVRCGTKMPDQSSTQLVGAAGQGAEGAEEYPWEPPAEWDPLDQVRPGRRGQFELAARGGGLWRLGAAAAAGRAGADVKDQHVAVAGERPAGAHRGKMV